MEDITTIFKDLMKDSFDSFYIFRTCCFTSFLTLFYLYYSTRVDQNAKKSMFYETSPLPPCMAQEFGMLYDTLWHIQLGAQLSGSGAQLSGSGAQLSAISAYLHTSYLGAQLSASHYIILNCQTILLTSPQKKLATFSVLKYFHFEI